MWLMCLCLALHVCRALSAHPSNVPGATGGSFHLFDEERAITLQLETSEPISSTSPCGMCGSTNLIKSLVAGQLPAVLFVFVERSQTDSSRTTVQLGSGAVDVGPMLAEVIEVRRWQYHLVAVICADVNHTWAYVKEGNMTRPWWHKYDDRLNQGRAVHTGDKLRIWDKPAYVLGLVYVRMRALEELE